MVHCNSCACPDSMRKYFLDGETTISDEVLQERKRKALFDKLFLAKLTTMKERLDTYVLTQDMDAKRKES